MMERRSGILLPIFSLPSKYGAGSFGKESFDFIDFLAKSNVKLWQILPLVQTGYGNSPYSSVCSTSFNPYFISVEKLKDEGLLDEEDLLETENEGFYVDYEFLYGVRFSLLKKAFKAFDKNESGFKKFIREKKFFDYAVFSALKTLNGYKPFYEWDEPFKKHDNDAIQKFYKQNRDEVLFWQFVQYVAEKQWKAVKKYANANGVSIVGDMPLYVALDSVDVWVNPELFKLDENFCPKKVAGVPPDYFSSTGQLWGNPVYDYSV
ncbi:MAG: 4-alpha-glucanotransferase, partial [Clostridia bacterium]|nr:4-alpha-glucanotransferase [Clostridia bacterium]